MGPDQMIGVLVKKRERWTWRQTCADGRWREETQGDDAHLQAKDGGRPGTVSPSCQHHNLGLRVSRTETTVFPWSKPPSLILCHNSSAD